MPGRVVVLGMDALVLPLVKRFVREGVLPHFEQVLREGSHSYALSVVPPYTPTNWATIATGSVPGRHGAGNWTDVTAGDARDRVPRSTFDARSLHADTVWNAASRAGRRSLLMTYPGAYPTTAPGVTVVAPLYRGLTGHVLAAGAEYTVTLSTGEGAVPLPVKSHPGGPLLVPTEDGHQELHPDAGEPFAGFAVARQGGQLVIYWRDQLLTTLPSESWSSWCEIPAPSSATGSVRFRLVADHQDTVRIIRSEIYPTQGFTDPTDYAPALYDRVGPFFEHPAAIRRDDDAAMEALLEEIRDQVDWYVGVLTDSAQYRPWDLFMTHWHWIDTAQHNFLAGLDPEPGVEPDERAVSIIRRSYQLGDRLLGGVLAELGDEDHLIVVSDHGHVPNRRVASVARRLVDVGLAVFDERTRPRQTIDRRQSRAYLLSPHEIVVNLQGRNDGGVVEPSAYRQTVDEIVDALMDWKDPETGGRLVGYALPKEHQHLLGYFGDRVGDVMFLYNPGYSWGVPQGGLTVGPADGSSNHGAQLPTTTTARTANMATLIARGPRIRAGYGRIPDERGYVSLMDVTPLIANLLGIAPPWDCRGAVPTDFLRESEL